MRDEREQKAFNGDSALCEICGEELQIHTAFFFYNISLNKKVYVHPECKGPWEVVMEVTEANADSKWWSVPPGWENEV